MDKDEDVEERERLHLVLEGNQQDGGASSFEACLDSLIIDY